jgi:hypothetical protein
MRAGGPAKRAHRLTTHWLISIEQISWWHATSRTTHPGSARWVSATADLHPDSALQIVARIHRMTRLKAISLSELTAVCRGPGGFPDQATSVAYGKCILFFKLAKPSFGSARSSKTPGCNLQYDRRRRSQRTLRCHMPTAIAYGTFWSCHQPLQSGSPLLETSQTTLLCALPECVSGINQFGMRLSECAMLSQPSPQRLSF